MYNVWVEVKEPINKATKSWIPRIIQLRYQHNNDPTRTGYGDMLRLSSNRQSGMQWQINIALVEIFPKEATIGKYSDFEFYMSLAHWIVWYSTGKTQTNLMKMTGLNNPDTVQ